MAAHVRRAALAAAVLLMLLPAAACTPLPGGEADADAIDDSLPASSEVALTQSASPDNPAAPGDTADLNDLTDGWVPGWH